MWCLTTSKGKGVNTSPESPQGRGRGKTTPPGVPDLPAAPGTHTATINQNLKPQPYDIKITDRWFMSAAKKPNRSDTRWAQWSPCCLSRCRECGHSSYFGYVWTVRHRCHRCLDEEEVSPRLLHPDPGFSQSSSWHGLQTLLTVMSYHCAHIQKSAIT